MRTKAGKMRDSIMRNLGAKLRSFTFCVEQAILEVLEKGDITVAFKTLVA